MSMEKWRVPLQRDYFGKLRQIGPVADIRSSSVPNAPILGVVQLRPTLNEMADYSFGNRLASNRPTANSWILNYTRM